MYQSLVYIRGHSAYAEWFCTLALLVGLIVMTILRIANFRAHTMSIVFLHCLDGAFFMNLYLRCGIHEHWSLQYTDTSYLDPATDPATDNVRLLSAYHRNPACFQRVAKISRMVPLLIAYRRTAFGMGCFCRKKGDFNGSARML
jgi:hypothetical protein